MRQDSQTIQQGCRLSYDGSCFIVDQGSFHTSVQNSLPANKSILNSQKNPVIFNQNMKSSYYGSGIKC